MNRGVVVASLAVGVAVTVGLYFAQPSPPSAADYAATAMLADQLQLERVSGRLVRDNARDPAVLPDGARARLGESLVIVGDNELPVGVGLAVVTLDPTGRMTHVIRERLAKHETSQILHRIKLEGTPGTWRVFFEFWISAQHAPAGPLARTPAELQERCPACKIKSVRVEVE